MEVTIKKTETGFIITTSKGGCFVAVYYNHLFTILKKLMGNPEPSESKAKGAQTRSKAKKLTKS